MQNYCGQSLLHSAPPRVSTRLMVLVAFSLIRTKHRHFAGEKPVRVLLEPSAHQLALVPSRSRLGTFYRASFGVMPPRLPVRQLHPPRSTVFAGLSCGAGSRLERYVRATRSRTQLLSWSQVAMVLALAWPRPVPCSLWEKSEGCSWPPHQRTNFVVPGRCWRCCLPKSEPQTARRRLHSEPEHVK
jgi:hypothetical protein